MKRILSDGWMIIGGFVIAIIARMSSNDIIAVIKRSWISSYFFKLLFSVLFILIIGEMMKKKGHLKEMLDAFSRLLKDNRISLIIPPALIGLLPMPGGAMFSAPMVEESAKDVKLKPYQKTYINYWFRHIWEYGWPLYPGLIIASSLLEVSIDSIIRFQGFFIIFPFIIGLIYVYKNVEHIKYHRKKRRRDYFKDIVYGIWPVAFILLFGVFLPFPIVGVLFSLIIIMMIVYRDYSVVKDFILHFPFATVILIMGIMFFKEMIISSNILGFLNKYYTISWFKYLLLFGLPFLTGLLTGVNQSYVAISFPILIPLLVKNGQVDYLNVAFAYISGFQGVLLSPVHLCLSLSKQYYGAEFKNVYKLLVPSVLILIIIELIWYIGVGR